MTTFTASVAASTDDATQSSSGVMDLTASALLADSNNDWIAVRIQAVAIAKGEPIVDARLTFEIDDSNKNDAEGTWYCQAIDDAPTFTTGANDISNRARTTASVSWTTNDLGAAGGLAATPNLAALVQEVVNRAGWVSGNDIVFIYRHTTNAEIVQFAAQDHATRAAPSVVIQYGTAVSGWRPSTADLLDLRGVPRRFDDYRFELVDRRNRPLGDLHPDLGRKPTVTWDTGRAVHRTLEGFYLPADEIGSVNPLTDRVRVWMVLQNGVEYSMGVFLWGDANMPLRAWGYEHDATLLDKTHIFDQPIVYTLSLPRSMTPLRYAYERLIIAHPEFDEQTQIDPDWRVDPENLAAIWILVALGAEGAEKELGSPVSWQPGTHKIAALNDIMALVGYMPVHANRDGTIILTNADPINQRPIDHTYTLENGRIIENSVNRPFDLLSAPNMVVVHDSSANSTPIWGVWSAPSTAPYSEANRGYRVSKSVSVTGLSNKAEAEREAKRIGEYLVRAGDWIEWQSPADPRHDGYDICSVLGDKVLEVAWKQECVAGSPMDHRALKVYPEEGVDV